MNIRLSGPGAALTTALATLMCACSPGPSASTMPPPSITVVPSPSIEAIAEPPAAALAAEGGDPIDGQLGSFTWLGGGSDSPWLPGTPIVVGAGEPLSVMTIDQAPIASWIVQARPGGAPGPTVDVARGAGPVRFTMPRAGTWSVAVHLTFANGAGAASYYWEVRAG